jgi:hypothetical protein
MNRAVFGFLAFIILIILIVILIFSGGGKKPANNSGPSLKPLPNYSTTDATTSMTIDGQINGDDIHRAIRITVSQNQREMDIIQGYNGTVISSQTFGNNQAAYAVFLRAINNYGFLQKLKNTKAPADERGQCPLGNRYIFELAKDGSTLSRLWASDCSVTNATLGGNSQTLQTLFEGQITQYNTLTENVNLASD